MLDTPVVFIVFNRPDTTERVFQAIRQARPKKLMVIADGARVDKPGEAEKCAAVRAIIDGVDWDCEVLKNYSEVNLGCGLRVSSGLDWVFSLVEAAIILEDDCLPHPSFFNFCAAMLEKYRDDPQIMHITGTNPLGKWQADRQSYHFSYFGGIWGWASWRRAWQHYDFKMKSWSNPDVREKIRQVVKERYETSCKTYREVYEGKVDTWDLQWNFARLSNFGLSIIPAVNLISNIGFGEDATHTTADPSQSYVAQLPTYPLQLPLTTRAAKVSDRDFDLRYFALLSRKPSLLSRVASKFGRVRQKLVAGRA